MRGRTWTTTEVRKLREMRAAGFDTAEIGEVLGRTKYAVQSYHYYLQNYHGHAFIPKLTAAERRKRDAA